jgi:hypothetical protein
MVANVIKQAREKHEHWYNTFVTYLADHHGKVADEFAITDAQCEFGKWIKTVGLVEHGELAEMHELAHAHHELHLHVCAIANSQHHHLKSRTELAKLEQTKQRVMDLLDSLEKKLAN